MLELEVKIKRSLRFEDLLTASAQAFKKILNVSQVPTLTLDVLDKGEIETLIPEQVNHADNLYCRISLAQLDDATVSILFVNLDHLLPHIPSGEAGCWAVVGAENRNLLEFPLVCSIALALSEMNQSCIIDERGFWLEHRETSYAEAMASVILTNPQNDIFEAAVLFNRSFPGRKQGER